MRHARQFTNAHEHPLGRTEVAAFERHVHVVEHAASGDEDAPVRPLRCVEYLLHARDQRGECRHDHAPFGFRHQLEDRFADDRLGGRVAGYLGVRRVSEQQ